MSTTSAPAHGLVTGRGPLPGDGSQSLARGWRSYLPAAAGVGYLAAWVAGLAAWPSNLALNASSAQVAASHQAHQTGAVVQYLLVEGVAGVLLGIVLAAVLGAAGGRRMAGARPAAVLGAVAVVISLVQCVLGLFLVAAAAGHDVSRAGDLFALVNRLDGVKMLALAGTAAWLAARRGVARRHGAHRDAARQPRWLQIVAGLAAVALVVSAVAYLLLANALAGTVYLAGVLLLLWVTGTGVWLTVSRRRRGSAAQGAA
jgi:hypothetical protein